MHNKRILSLSIAMKMADAIEKKAKELGIKIVIAILDDGGHLKYFRRMDGTYYASVGISQKKANTAAGMAVSSKALSERNAKLAGSPYGGGAIEDVILLGGGLPILTQTGELIGAVGISGANQELDEICAQAGLDAISVELA